MINEEHKKKNNIQIVNKKNNKPNSKNNILYNENKISFFLIKFFTTP